PASACSGISPRFPCRNFLESRPLVVCTVPRFSLAERRGPRRPPAEVLVTSSGGRGSHRGAEVANLRDVRKKPEAERRRSEQPDRRKNSRSGRRAKDPHVNWRRLAWLFAVYATFLSIRSLPSALRRRWKRERAA